MSRLKKAAWTSLALILIAGIGIGVGAHLILENTALKECTDLCLQQNRYQGQTATFDACLNDVPYCVQQQGVNNDSAFWAGVALVAIGAISAIAFIVCLFSMCCLCCCGSGTRHSARATAVAVASSQAQTPHSTPSSHSNPAYSGAYSAHQVQPQYAQQPPLQQPPQMPPTNNHNLNINLAPIYSNNASSYQPQSYWVNPGNDDASPHGSANAIEAPTAPPHSSMREDDESKGVAMGVPYYGDHKKM